MNEDHEVTANPTKYDKMGQTLITVTGTTHDHSQVVLLAGRGWSDGNKCFQLKVFPYIDVVALRPRAGTLLAF